MKRKLLCLALGAFWVVPVLPVAAQVEPGRDPKDRFEIEGNFGFYGKVAFPTTRHENPAYTPFVPAAGCTCASLQPNIRSRDARWQAGFRASYDLTPRWSVEYGFTFTQSNNFRFDDLNRFADQVNPAGGPVDVTVEVLRPEAGALRIHSLNGVYHFRQRGRWVPYVTGGANVVTGGPGPGIKFTRSEFTPLTSVFDSAELAYNDRFTRPGGNVGGGVKFYLGRHFGLRSDARFLFVNSKFRQRGSLVRVVVGPGAFLSRFLPDVVSEQRGLYSTLHVTVGVFTRF